MLTHKGSVIRVLEGLEGEKMGEGGHGLLSHRPGRRASGMVEVAFFQTLHDLAP